MDHAWTDDATKTLHPSLIKCLHSVRFNVSYCQCCKFMNSAFTLSLNFFLGLFCGRFLLFIPFRKVLTILLSCILTTCPVNHIMVEVYHCFNILAFRSLEENRVRKQKHPFDVKYASHAFLVETLKTFYLLKIWSRFVQPGWWDKGRIHIYLRLDGNATLCTDTSFCLK